MKYIILITWVCFLLYPSQASTQNVAYSDSYAYLNNNNLNSLPDTSDAIELKKRGRALGIALGATLGPYVLAVIPGLNLIGTPLIPVGFLAGPSMGYLYTDNGDKIWRGTFVRLGGSALMALGGLGALGGGYGGDSGLYTAGVIVMLGGLGIYTYRFIYDIVQSMRLVDKYNANQKSRVQLMPSVNPYTESVGLTLRVRF
ncbi:hypothetical protein [Gracilimonas sp.]|uniref:hypothetical protein n=1 Tax=Gracilimonas sp. TaxID=1974203 RepID=UPI003BA98B83